MIPTTPVRVEYYLTDKGRELEPVIRELAAWAHKWIALPAGAAPDVHRARGS